MIVNSKAEAAAIVARLNKGGLLEIVVAIGGRGNIVTYRINSKIFARMSESEKWRERCFIGVYQWGAKADDIEADIDAVLMSERVRRDQESSMRSEPPQKAPKKWPSRKPRNKRISPATARQILCEINRRKKLLEIIRTELSDQALANKYGVAKTTLFNAAREARAKSAA